MKEIIVLILCIIAIVLFKKIFKVSFKEAKKIEDNSKMQKITDKFPPNIEIAKEMLEIINNKSVKIEQEKETKTSLYIAITNKILIADLKNNYGRIGTVAHECMHSVQDRRLLLFNFIFSNITIVYFIIGIVLTLLKIYKNSLLQVFFLLLLFFIQFAVRGFLEIDAMTKSKYLAKEYMEKKNLCAKQEIEQLINEYDKINKMGIAFTLYKLFSNALIKIIIYDIIAYITLYI